MRFSALRIATAPLAGVTVVEASAGTGKTWAIAALFVRLVLEKKLPVERILVVTYTKAATAELRGRIRDRLVKVRDLLDVGDRAALRSSGDELLEWLADFVADPVEARRLLSAAVESFDLAPIFTIHGFCQRALAEHAFETGEPFAAELITEDGPLVDEAVQDFWRCETASVSPAWSAWLHEKGVGPESLAALVRALERKPYAEVLARKPREAAQAPLERAFATATRIWTRENISVLRLLEEAIEAKALNGKSYKTGKLPEWAGALDVYFSAGMPNAATPEALQRLSAAVLACCTNAKKATPQHPFFSAADTLLAAALPTGADFEAAVIDLRRRALDASRTRLAALKRERGLVSFGDLVQHLAAALEGEAGDRLAERLRARYGAALVDEFQDTDPPQYTIFRRVFATAEGPLYLVGDPKQAIYGFRGADVHAYLAAREAAQAQRTLLENFRAEPGLVTAVNALFAGAEPFLIDGIAFSPAASAPVAPAPAFFPDDVSAPLSFRFMAREPDKELIDKGVANDRAAEATAAEVSHLLTRAQRGEAKLGEESIRGGDIAILVPSHRQGALVKRALARRGIASVSYGQDSVFKSGEALEMERVLMAVAEPSREALVRAALSTDLLGGTAETLAALDADEPALAAQLEAFGEYHALAREHGFARMWRALEVERGVAERLLSLADGERRLTNVTHLAELLQQAALAGGLDLERLVRVLANAREAGLGDAESEQLRLESDGDLVKILTVHAAKGLQFPIVFCPFLWDGRLRSTGKKGGAPVAFHRRDDGHRAVFDLGSEHIDEHRELAARDELAERLRLAYVALTRAQYRTVVVWGAVKDAYTSALFWLLHRPKIGAGKWWQALETGLKALDDTELRATLADLERRSEGTVATRDLAAGDVERLRPETAAAESLAARVFCGRVPEQWRVSSYTGLVARYGSEAPDHDAAGDAPLPEVVERAEGSARTLFDFPRGVRAGTLIHKLFEHTDFAEPSGAEDLARKLLLDADFDSAWATVLSGMLANVAATPLDGAGRLRLADVPRTKRVDELEFVFPSRAASGAALLEALAAERARTGIGMTDERIAQGVLPGFMKGFIDLVFEADGRYFLADYKSNHLGSRFEDYAPAVLALEMAERLYDAQYLLYVVALDRYLATRRCDYDYDRHFGGVFYLFVRGMHPARGATTGVHFARPDRVTVERLAAALTRNTRLFA